MNQFIEAADAIRTIVKRLEGFQLAANALEQIGSIDQAAKEAQAARAKAVKEADKAKDELAAVEAAMVAAKERVALTLAEANVRASALTAQAAADADKIATAAAAAMAKAQAEHQASLAAFAAEVKAEVAKHKDIAKKAKDKAEALEAEIAEKQGQLDSLNAMLAEIKTKLGA